jgi:hypothetical protein
LVEHRKALVDVHYSNSLIEAHNKILKYTYLYRMAIPDGDQLGIILPKIVDDFNNRPHISLGGLTPNEAEKNIMLDEIVLSNYKRQAALERKIYNKAINVPSARTNPANQITSNGISRCQNSRLLLNLLPVPY